MAGRRSWRCIKFGSTRPSIGPNWVVRWNASLRATAGPAWPAESCLYSGNNSCCPSYSTNGKPQLPPSRLARPCSHLAKVTTSTSSSPVSRRRSITLERLSPWCGHGSAAPKQAAQSSTPSCIAQIYRHRTAPLRSGLTRNWWNRHQSVQPPHRSSYYAWLSSIGHVVASFWRRNAFQRRFHRRSARAP